MYVYHIQRIQHLEPADMFSRLELCFWINSNLHTIWFIFSPTRPILPAMESTVLENPIYGIVIILMELSKTTTNIAFRKGVVWCGVIGDQLTGPYILP